MLHFAGRTDDSPPPAPGDGPLARPGTAARARRLRLLVCDDDADSRAALALALGQSYELLSASDGLEALALVHSGHPDIILLDLMMPKLDGFEVLRQLADSPVTALIPVLVISARRDDADKVAGLTLGAVDYLEKPFSATVLRARVERTGRLLRAQDALREQAQTDPLTGLANIRTFREHLEAECRRSQRYGSRLTCVMVDLDGLKVINDELGHAAGDRALTTLAAVLRQGLRDSDLCARYGGDEFVMLLPHASAEEGRLVAERACARLRRADLTVGGRQLTLGASFGVSSLEPGGHRDARALLEEADAALYRAKASGRGRVELADRVGRVDEGAGAPAEGP
jgi:diguanylate cyclase (GGDEF)-like protein